MVLLQGNLYFSKVQEVVQHYPGGGGGGGPTFPGVGGGGLSNFFQVGIHLLIYLKTHITCDFQKNVFLLRRFF